MGILLDTLYLYGFMAAPGQFSESVQTDTDSLPAPEVIAAEIADDLEAALEQFTRIAERLGETASAP